jgi:hypothetical protein
VSAFADIVMPIIEDRPKASALMFIGTSHTR